MQYIHAAKKPDVGMLCNGELAGLVAITAPCAYVSPTASVIIGSFAGVWVIWCVAFVENKLKVDDPVGAVAVHMGNGLLGLFFVGLFACGTYGAGTNGVTVTIGDKPYGVLGMLPIGAPEGTPWGYFGQMKSQLFFIVVDFLVVFSIEYAFFKVYHAIWGLRVSAEDEVGGLDIPETGTPAYPNFPIHDFIPGYAGPTGSAISTPAGTPVLKTAAEKA
jgi:Amt family ammonium transporter